MHSQTEAAHSPRRRQNETPGSAGRFMFHVEPILADRTPIKAAAA